MLGSGIKEVGPRIPLYSAPANNLTDWTFLGALWEPTANETLGDVLETGTYAFNFEVSNFFSLIDDDGEVHYYVLMVLKVETRPSTRVPSGVCGTKAQFRSERMDLSNSPQ